jgi:hypothetical protein
VAIALQQKTQLIVVFFLTFVAGWCLPAEIGPMKIVNDLSYRSLRSERRVPRRALGQCFKGGLGANFA